MIDNWPRTIDRQDMHKLIQTNQNPLVRKKRGNKFPLCVTFMFPSFGRGINGYYGAHGSLSVHVRRNMIGVFKGRKNTAPVSLLFSLLSMLLLQRLLSGESEEGGREVEKIKWDY